MGEFHFPISTGNIVGNGEGIGVAFQLYVKSVHFSFPSVGCSVFHVGGDSFLKRGRFTSGIYRVVRKKSHKV